ncbi:hypothetical protein [Longicatena caecimuris]|uniref:hypothetical protein n=1 Tax=Longicatena caecimuris TaxID=1796635 RepID=UPI0002DEEFE1|nr:hypothetical protein DW840_02850 [Eubacterium sp. AM35-6AC]BCT45759.1 hypothetical protein L3BBH23_22040 [Longicatena caecimuris]
MNFFILFLLYKTFIILDTTYIEQVAFKDAGILCVDMQVTLRVGMKLALCVDMQVTLRVGMKLALC